MDKLDRFQKPHRLFKSRRYPISVATIAKEMECTPKTAQRNIEAMRDYYHAPLKHFPRRGWQYIEEPDNLFELPGFWLTAQELQSLALLLHLLENLGPGLLSDELKAVHSQIDRLLNTRKLNYSLLAEKLRILPQAARHLPGNIFLQLSEVLLKQQQITIKYQDYSQRLTTRSISPQTLVHYRDNWYIDAWCHLRKELRTFSLARIEALFPDSRINGKTIPNEQLKTHFEQSYGVFAGTPKHVAKLRFFPEIAREISLQQWHPDQQGKWDGDDYLLSFPYSDARELIGDIMRYIPNIQVEAPASLRKQVKNKLLGGLELFS